MWVASALARGIGLTHIHVNRVLRNLRKEGVAEFHYRRLRILNPDRLVDVAGIDPRVAMAWIDSDLLNEENAQRFLY